jgi:hypothetical protein
VTWMILEAFDGRAGDETISRPNHRSFATNV